MSTIGDRILAVRKESKLTQEEFASSINVSRASIAQIEIGRQLPTLETITNIVNIYNKTYDFIFSGITTDSKIIKKEGLPLIPIEAIAGIANGNTDSVLLMECERYIVPDFKDKADYLIRINGSSMYPKYNSGDIVACKKLPIDTFFQWNKVYILDTVQGALVKRVQKSDKADYITLVSDNPKYEPFDIHTNQIHALALVIGVIRLE